MLRTRLKEESEVIWRYWAWMKEIEMVSDRAGSFARAWYIMTLKQCSFRKCSFVEIKFWNDRPYAGFPRQILTWIWKEGGIGWRTAQEMTETRWLYVSALQAHLPVFLLTFLLPGTASNGEGAVEIKLKKIMRKGVTAGVGEEVHIVVIHIWHDKSLAEKGEGERSRPKSHRLLPLGQKLLGVVTQYVTDTELRLGLQSTLMMLRSHRTFSPLCCTLV